ncbi:DUF2490 domain-containing protein [Dysgonomonas sp. 216]|uniref:DUF2490 domain-containing protein n=1 Tax=Dysgonomonas sp. 216 TaxID=2302934 RepID=UPI0013CFB263|nr:DUF2490 domain-containing protein [Dysgonomonas sp. 216]NDW19789.1 DUF2490 domain-containing protein [Dysgonomonas sp. 216]
MKKFSALICLLLLAPTISEVQASDNDFGVWTNIEVEKKLIKGWAVNGELDFRTKENSSEVGRWGLKLGTDYSIIKGLKIGAAYQFIYFHDIKYWDFQPRHRFIGYLQGRQKLGNFVFSLRERFQFTEKDDSDRIKKNGKKDKYKINPEWSWRNRMKIAYDIPKCKFTPSFAFESFYQLNNSDGNEFDGLRYTLSLAYKLNKKQTFDLSGILDKEVNVKNAVDTYVISVGYSYSF